MGEKGGKDWNIYTYTRMIKMSSRKFWYGNKWEYVKSYSLEILNNFMLPLKYLSHWEIILIA